jgi:AcrR family transcriptional regulator
MVSSTTLQRPMRADARRNYEQILSVAREAFAAHGPDASLDEIARRAGVGVGTLYRHFPTRFALQEAVLRDGIDELTVKADELRDSPSPGDALAQWLREQLAHDARNHGLGSAIVASMPEWNSSDSCQRMTAAAAELLARAQDAREIRSDIDAPSLLHLVHGIALAHQHAPDTVQAEKLLSIMLDGLRP